MRERIIVGVSGASGAPIALRCLKELHSLGAETYLIMTDGARETIPHETGLSVEEFAAFADIVLDNDDLSAPVSSGTFRSSGMLIVPCSMKTAAAINAGLSLNLLLRAADVIIKEKRPLVLCPRETPLSPIHLRNLYELSKLEKVSVVPPMMSYYGGLTTAEDMTGHIAHKLLAALGFDCEGFVRWKDE